ncbi:MAG: beta-fructofuranosidase, partial [Candidatus Poribacteria bacterium]|nr:beta-fructofuranosidase [Candidatus Poribacteria bacterium]
RKHWGIKNIDLMGNYVLEANSVICEVIAEIELGNAKQIGLDMRASDDFETRSRVYFDVEQKELYIGKYRMDFELLEDEQVLRIHTFVDHGVMETFVNRRECGTLRPYNDLNHRAMRLFSNGGAAYIRSVDVWEMGSIWERR